MNPSSSTQNVVSGYKHLRCSIISRWYSGVQSAQYPLVPGMFNLAAFAQSENCSLLLKHFGIGAIAMVSLLSRSISEKIHHDQNNNDCVAEPEPAGCRECNAH
jgi:hypothetical protein